MKLEVGKKYDFEHGGVGKCIAQTSLAQYVIEDGGDVYLVDHKGKGVGNSFGCDLIKEHVEPRTKDVWVVIYDDGECNVVEERRELYDEDGNIYSNLASIQKLTITEGERNE